MKRKQPNRKHPALPESIADLIPKRSKGSGAEDGIAVVVVPDCDTSMELQSFLDELGSALMAKPKEVVLRFIGVHQMGPDPALLIHHVLQERDPSIRLRTEALSPIIGPGVLLWLAGDTRFLRPTAWLYIMTSTWASRRGRTNRGNHGPESWQSDPDGPGGNLAEIDLHTVLELIHQYLPVEELGDKPMGPGVLREFGLIDGDRFEAALTAAFSSPPSTPPAGPRDSVTERSGPRPPERTDSMYRPNRS